MRNIRQNGVRFSCVDVDSLGQYDYIPKPWFPEVDLHGFWRSVGSFRMAAGGASVGSFGISRVASWGWGAWVRFDWSARLALSEAAAAWEAESFWVRFVFSSCWTTLRFVW